MAEEYTDYKIGNTWYSLPNSLSDEEKEKALGQLYQQAPKEAQQAVTVDPYRPFGEVIPEVEPEDLQFDEEWLRAAKALQELDSGRTVPMLGSVDDPARLNKWARLYMSRTYSLTDLGKVAHMVKEEGTQHQKEAFVYMMDQFDEAQMSWWGAAAGFDALLGDPLTYVGGGAFGASVLVKQSERAAIMESIKQGMRTGVVAGAEGGIYAATDNTIRQGAEVDAGLKEDIDNWEVAEATGAGVLFGFGLGTVIGAVADQVAVRLRGAGKESSQAGVPTVSMTDEVETTGVPATLADEVGAGSKKVPEPTATATPRVTSEGLAGVPETLMDEVGVPVSGKVEKVVEGEVLGNTKALLKVPERETPVPYAKQTVKESHEFAKALAEDLKGLHYTQTEDVVEHLRTGKMTDAEFETFGISVKDALDNTITEINEVTKKIVQASDETEAFRLRMLREELDIQRQMLRDIDAPLASRNAAKNRWRQEGLTQTRKESPESIMEETGVSREEAYVEFARRAEAERASKAAKDLEREYDQQITTLQKQGKQGEAVGLIAEKHQALDALSEMSSGNEPGFWAKYVELAISNVFTTTTVMINVASSGAKMIYRPALKSLVDNPFELATRKELAATYSAMRAATNGALRAAWAAFKYEQAILSGGDPMKVMEGAHLAFKGKWAEYVRIFPRLVNASDEFLSRLTYEGFVAGKAAAEATEAGVKKGLNGKELDRFIKSETGVAVKGAYDENLETKVAILLRKGENLKLEGPRLVSYIKQEMARSGADLKIGKDHLRTYVDEVLFKNRFGKSKKDNRAEVKSRVGKVVATPFDAIDNFHEDIWARYEQVVNDWPIFRVMGQLFLRTPVRVFEEGMRMTPVIQTIAPHFVNDLLGRNGRMSQVRAQGEALVSMAFAGTVLSLYAQGKVTGDGAYSDWRQQRTRTDSSLPGPYTIMFDDGTTWNYRNFDPLSTPIKIMVNGLERWENLEMRRRQGELLDETEFDKALAPVYIAMASVGQSLRDANLMSGVGSIVDVLEDLNDPQKNEGALIRFLGDKLRVLVPNTLHKTSKTFDPTLTDPVTFEQVMEARVVGTLGVDLTPVPSSYDSLGNKRRMDSAGPLWSIFATVSEEERKKGKNEDELAVLERMDFITKRTGRTFDTPYKHSMLPGVDLRKHLTVDGKETLYDKWNRLYNEREPERVLRPVIESELPIGTMTIDASVGSATASMMSGFRDMAFVIMLSEEGFITEEMSRGMLRDVEVKSGLHDIR